MIYRVVLLLLPALGLFSNIAIAQIKNSEYSTEVFATQIDELNRSFQLGIENPKFQLTKTELRTLQSEITQKLHVYEQGQYNPNQLVNSSQLYTWTNKLFIDGRIQEGIWLLDIFGYFSESENFSIQFEQYVTNQTLRTENYIDPDNICEARWGHAGNLPVVIKRDDSGWHGAIKAEVWVYHLDRILGLNLVPLTFITHINNYEYSVQAAIMNAPNTNIDFRMTHYNDTYPEIFILDFLIENRDRHGKNSLFSPLGLMVAIDNGRSAAIKNYQEYGKLWQTGYPHYNLSKLPRMNIVKTIADLDLTEFTTEFAKYAPPEVVESVTMKLMILKNDFAKYSISIKPSWQRPLVSKLRLNSKFSDNQISTKAHNQILNLKCETLIL